MLAAPKCSSQCWSITESVPPVPADPENFLAILATVSLMMSIGTNVGGLPW